MKTNLDSLFKTNELNEKEGIWIEVGDQVSFKCKMFGGANAHRIKQLQVKYLKPYTRQIENGLMDEKKERLIYTKIFVEACLVDWKGIVEDDKDVPFSPEKAVELFTSLPKLFDYLVGEATNNDRYVEDLGNS